VNPVRYHLPDGLLAASALCCILATAGTGAGAALREGERAVLKLADLDQQNRARARQTALMTGRATHRDEVIDRLSDQILRPQRVESAGGRPAALTPRQPDAVVPGASQPSHTSPRAWASASRESAHDALLTPRRRLCGRAPAGKPLVLGAPRRLGGVRRKRGILRGLADLDDALTLSTVAMARARRTTRLRVVLW
jgi:hypothetical protein